MQISAVIITFNEERNIADAIRSVDWADEVLVVDSCSTDRTRKISENLGARVIERSWTGFADQKNFATDAAAFDLIFSLDADERVSAKLKESITRLRQQDEVLDGYRMARLAFYGERPVRHGGWYPDHQLRLFDRRKGRWTNVAVHESVEMPPDARIGTLEGDILHYTISGVREHQRLVGERYAPLGADKMIAQGRGSSPAKAALTGIAVFLKTYLVKLGFLDGTPGLCVAWFAAHNAFLKHMIVVERSRANADGDAS